MKALDGKKSCCSVVLVWLLSPFLFALVAWVLAVWPALSWLPPPSLPPWLSSGAFWSSQSCCPPSGHLVVFATVRLSYLWHGVSWLIGSCLPSASWQQRLRPCVGLCPLHHVVGVVHVPLAAALRYSPSGDQNPLRTPLKLYAPTLALFGLVCPPRCPLSWLVFMAPPPSWLWIVLLAWPVFCLVGFVWFFCVLVVSGCFLFFASCFCWLRLTSVWTGTFVYFAFTCTTKALIDHCTCVSVRRLDRFTCTVEFHRSTTS